MAQITASILIKQPCIKYKATFQHHDLDKVTLMQRYADGATVKKKYQIFTGKEGIEGLLYIEEKFRKISRQLNYDNGEELFDNWDDCLDDSAEEKWDTLVSGIANDQRTVARFNAEMKNYYRRYVDNKARDTLVDYLRNLKKPVDATPQEYADRKQTLIKYANILPGTVEQIPASTSKKMIFDGFPETWRQEYVRKQTYATAELDDIIQFMTAEKNFADAAQAKQKRKNQEMQKKKEEPHRKKKGDFYGKHNYRTNNDSDLYRNVPFKADCPKHGSSHTAGACMQNPYGPRYKGRQGSNFRGGNRNGNRNYGGQGHDYHQNQNQNNNGNQWNRNDRANQQSNYYQGSYYQQNTPVPMNNNGNMQSRPVQPQGGPPAEVHAFDMIGQHNGGERCERSLNNTTRWPGQNGWES